SPESLRRKEALMTIIPELLQPMLRPMADAFTRPTFKRFFTLMAAAILNTGRRTVSNLLRTAGGLATGQPSSYHSVFSRRRWSTWTLARALAGRLLRRFAPDEPVPLAGDDTVDEHRGGKVYGKGRHRDPVRSTHSYTAWRWGPKWVVLAILVQFPFASRPWALPVLAGQSDQQIATELTAAGYHAPLKRALNVASVSRIRWQHRGYSRRTEFQRHA